MRRMNSYFPENVRLKNPQDELEGGQERAEGFLVIAFSKKKEAIVHCHCQIVIVLLSFFRSIRERNRAYFKSRLNENFTANSNLLAKPQFSRLPSQLPSKESTPLPL